MSDAALSYHRQTSYDRSAMTGHGLDWSAQPDVFKTYPGLPTVTLPHFAPVGEKDLHALIHERASKVRDRNVTAETLSRLVALSHCITARARHGGTDFYYRNAASAGALYPFELYLAVDGAAGLEDGLYHHTLALGGLTPLRRGDVMAEVCQALALPESSAVTPVFFLTAIFFRSAWKYRDRAYRYHLLDTGHLAECVALALRAEGLAFEFHDDFDDGLVNRLLGVDPAQEACLTVACVRAAGEGKPSRSRPAPAPAADLARASRVSVREVVYQPIAKIHSACCVVAGTDSDLPVMVDHLGVSPQESGSIPAPGARHKTVGYPEVLFKRRSRRNFVAKPVSDEEFGALSSLLCGPLEGDGNQDRHVDGCVGVGFLVGSVAGMAAGCYLLNRRDRSVTLVRPGDFRDQMAHICLGQMWLSNAALHVVFMTNLGVLEKAWGPRGYRYAMLAAGRLGQRTYLGATALGLGCCGIGAFYDGEAANLLGLNPESALLYLVAVGRLKR